MKKLAILASFLVICGCELDWISSWYDGEQPPPEPQIINATAFATVESIDADIGEAVVLTTDGNEFVIELPETPVLVVGDLVEISITFESVADGEYVIVDVVFVRLA